MLDKVLDIFSSVKLGIVLLALLFVYMSVGSAGIVYPVHPNIFHPDAWVHAQMRQWRPFELTEFEWFHWWPFQVLMGLIALNMTVTTIRRIPLRVGTLGVWTIHSGVLVLIAGSLWYFGMKVEGDAPIARRKIVLKLGDEQVEMLASPGASAQLGEGPNAYQVEVAIIDPEWELRSGDETGKRVYSVTLAIKSPSREYMRQLLAGYPQFTEDMIITGDHKQPVKRAKKELGVALVDEALVAELEYEPQQWFYLRNDLDKSFAIYIREVGKKEWHQRPLAGMPLYNDYVASPDMVFQVRGDEPMPSEPLSLSVGAESAGDPFQSTSLKVIAYLRHAVMRSRFSAGAPGSPVNPVATLRVAATEGEPADYTLEAMNPQKSTADGGLVAFRLAGSEADFERMSRPASLRLQVPELGIDVTETIHGLAVGESQAFTEIGPPGSGCAYRVVGLQDDLNVGGMHASVAIVELRTPKGESRRWVFDDSRMTRDAPEGEGMHTPKPIEDESIQAEYMPGIGGALVTLVAGPDLERLRVITAIGKGEPEAKDVRVGEEALRLPAGLTMTVSSYLSHAVQEAKPLVVPMAQRERDARELSSMILVELAAGERVWLPYHHYVFDDEAHVLRRHQFATTTVDMGGGVKAEMLFSRRRLPLPAPVGLDSFALATHIGGYTGEATTIRDYTSMISFEESGAWTAPVPVSVNSPVEHDGYWFFQAQWDPPDPSPPAGARPSAGLNYTVLGVGNREGVYVQLAGCIIAVLGMIYAFTVKPALRRRANARAASDRAVSSGGGSGRSADAVTAAKVGALLAILLPLGFAEARQAVPFAQAVDLTPLAEVAVQTEGRIKSFGSHANTVMGFISGPRRIAGQSPEFTYLDMLFRNEAYQDADVIFVKGGAVRAPIAECLLRTDPTLTDRMQAFVSTGLISPELLDRPELESTMRSMAADLLRTARSMEMIDGARATMLPESLLGRLRIVPPGTDALNGQWHGIAEIMAQAADRAAADRAGVTQDPLPGIDNAAQMRASRAWRNLVEGWARQDVPKTNTAVVELAAALEQCASGGYPDKGRLRWESWYFRNGNLTRIWIAYMAAIVLLLLGVVYRWRKTLIAGLALFTIALALQTAAIGLRWWISQRWPNSNMYEAVTTAAWMGCALALPLEMWLRRTRAQGLFAITAAVGSMVALMSAHFLPVYLNPNISNMMPVLNDVWLYIHTNVIIFSYALIFMAAVAAVLYLVYRMFAGADLSFARAGGAGLLGSSAGPAGPTAQTGSWGEILDGVTMMLMQISFVMLWSGIVMGAIWADHSWGRPWGWDPKEVFALNTFVIFALLIHVRYRVKDKGLWTAILAVVGAGVMLFNWIVINFIITGLHSYA